MIVVWALLALIAIWIVASGAFTWYDARKQSGASPQELLRLVLVGIVDPLRYWYLEKPLRLPVNERTAWLQHMAEKLGLSNIQAARCPLCGTEIPTAWTTDERGRLTVAPGPVKCPACDFRLDACRHCRYFRPAGIRQSMAIGGGSISWTHGYCTYYKTMQPVEELTTSDMARRMRERGYTHLRGPTPITDSYVPLEHCTAFRLDPKRLQHSGVRKPGRRQRLALRVLSRTHPTTKASPKPEGEPDEEAQWLL
ncbi:MAG: hypothetical protein J7M34_05340 [Anaerolineae bacterium]|nr:hypothetical protein [Anaerolineae bacterium]